MSEKARATGSPDREEGEGSLSSYKETDVPVSRATLTWDKELVFVASTPRGYEIEFDANVEWGCMPMDALLMSLAGCMAIDVVAILQKMRAAPATFRMEIAGVRNARPPQYFKEIEIVLHLAGDNLDAKKVERAVSLSQSKYCSVYNTLRDDIDVKVRYEIEGAKR